MKKRTSFLILTMIFTWFVSACVATPSRDQALAEATYRGTTSSGQPVDLTIAIDEVSITGHGSLGGEKLNISGLTAWRGTGKGLYADGTIKNISWELLPDRQTLVIHGLGEALTLDKTAAADEITAGPISGDFVGQDDRSAPFEARLVQDGNLIHGTAAFLGDIVAILGRMTTPDSAEGMLIFRDGSRKVFSARISEDANTVEIGGLGKPIVLNKKVGRSP